MVQLKGCCGRLCNAASCVCRPHLSGCNEDLSILGCAEVVHHTHQLTRLRLGFLGLRYVQVHLIAIKVSVVGTAHAFIEAESPAANIIAR